MRTQNFFVQQLREALDWTQITPILNELDWEAGDEPRRQPLVLLKVLLLQHCYELTDAQCQELLTDRESWRRFVGLSTGNDAPDETDMKSFRAKLVEKGLHTRLLGLCSQQLELKSLRLTKGSMADASLERRDVLPPRASTAVPPNQFLGRNGAKQTGAVAANLFRRLKAKLYARDLVKLALLFESDKWNTHWYARHYQHHFGSLRRKPVKLLEIGIGGYDDPRAGGASLRMWKAFFPNGRIYGLDKYDKSFLKESRIQTFCGDQRDADFLRRMASQIGPLDIVVDDGSHINRDVIQSFNVLFPLMADKGIYVVEDTQTAYWSQFGGDSRDSENQTSMRMFKALADGLNYEEFIRPGYVPTYFDEHIVSLHFYHNLVFVYKGLNQEGSNMVVSNSFSL